MWHAPWNSGAATVGWGCRGLSSGRAKASGHHPDFIHLKGEEELINSLDTEGSSLESLGVRLPHRGRGCLEHGGLQGAEWLLLELIEGQVE